MLTPNHFLGVKRKRGGTERRNPPCHPQPRAFGKLALRFTTHSTFRCQTVRLPMFCVLSFASCVAVTRAMLFDHGIFFMLSRCWRSILYSRGWAVMGTGCSGGPANAPIIVVLLIVIIIPLGKSSILSYRIRQIPSSFIYCLIISSKQCCQTWDFFKFRLQILFSVNQTQLFKSPKL